MQRQVPIECLRPNDRNPRRGHSDAELDELAESIRERGIIQPIVVREVRDVMDTYEIITGERRWRAAKRAGLPAIPIVLLDVTDSEALEMSIIENVQRADLNPLDEAAGYQVLADEYGLTQEAIARIIGKSRSYVANLLRLLKLPDEVKDYVHSGKLTASHVRSLVTRGNAQQLADHVVQHGLTVREVEALPQERASDADDPEAPTRVQKKRDAHALALEKGLSDVLGLSVRIGRRQNGMLHVRYKNFEQLEEVLFRLENSSSDKSQQPGLHSWPIQTGSAS
jgi:ParB family chromosome partitioning protein